MKEEGRFSLIGCTDEKNHQISNKNTDHETFISAEYVNMIELKDTINDHLTTWTEWTSCSPYCKRSRYRVCSGEFKCYNEADGVSEPVLCTGRS